jgi:hypothetical protein
MSKLAIGRAKRCAVGAAVTGMTDWSDVDPLARRLGLMHGLLNVGANGLFTTSLILRKKHSRTESRIASGLGYAVMSYAAHLGGKMLYIPKPKAFQCFLRVAARRRRSGQGHEETWARTEEGGGCHFGPVHLTNIWNSGPVGMSALNRWNAGAGYRGRPKPWKANAWFNNSRCSVQIVDLSTRGSGRLRNSLVSLFAEQKVNFSTQQNGKARKVKPHV